MTTSFFGKEKRTLLALNRVGKRRAWDYIQVVRISHGCQRMEDELPCEAV